MFDHKHTHAYGQGVSRKSRDEWIAEAFKALSTGGVDALHVEPLARSLGVTKGSFYHHFSDRRALHLALLDAWEDAGTSAVISGVERSASRPEERLAALLELTFKPDPVSDSIEAAIRAWAPTDPDVAEVASRVDARRVDFVAGELVAAGLPRPLAERRALLLYRVLIGEFIWRSAGGPPSTDAEIRDLAALLLLNPE